MLNALPVDAVELREIAKYNAIWATERYGRSSPGERIATRFKRLSKARPGAYIIDLGAGAGEGAKRLQVMGYRVAALDIVEEQFRFRGEMPFFHQPLWREIPWATDKRCIRRKWTYGYCCDVMEHIPPDRVREVLRCIRASCIWAFFSISHEPDVFGRAVGQPLHLTVKPFEWWLEEIKEVFDAVEDGRDLIRQGLYLCRS